MKPANILIIEDDPEYGQQLSGVLGDKGFNVDCCGDGEQGLLAALNQKFDLVLLDVELPTLSGFSVLKRLRKVKQTPVMMLTGCSSEGHRIEGFRSGADDYLPKPFSITEMVLRVEALLRRTLKQEGCTRQCTLVADDLTLQRISKQVTYGDCSLDLTPIQFRLLWTLIENRGDVLSKPYLYQAVLERPFARYDRTLDMHLSRIRKKLEEVGMGNEHLVTVHGKGYRFH